MSRTRTALALIALWAAIAAAQVATPAVPPPTGFVTDRAGVIDAATRDRLTRLLRELQEKTGSEIAVLTVDTTEPLDDFTYAMEVADAWKIGKKGEDTGALVLVAVRDRKVRVLTGYGLEGILPDGLVGEIQDRYMVPSFRAGNMSEGIWQGAAEIARRIAASRGVTLTGAPAAAAPRRVTNAQPQMPFWLMILIVVALMLLMSRGGMGGRRGWRGRRGPMIFPGGFGGGDGGFGGFGGGGGGFGGFGGGGFGGGGAGRSW